MKKDDKLFFRTNNGEYKLAFNLPKNDYYIYLENINEKNCSNIKFIFIRIYTLASSFFLFINNLFIYIY